MRTVTAKVFDEGRIELAEFYPFTIIIHTVLLTMNLREITHTMHKNLIPIRTFLSLIV